VEDRYLRLNAVAAFLGVSVMTIHRRRKDPSLGFPAPCVINKIPHWRLSELIQWMEQHRAS
jgi:predicted DNA-binding transcriptional regulator AlpA